jgi:hypothetical protein
MTKTTAFIAVAVSIALIALLALPSCSCFGNADDSGGSDDNGGKSDDESPISDDSEIEADDYSDDVVSDDDTDAPDDDVDDTGDDDDLLAPLPTDDNGIFVSVQGNDANPGTKANPVATINHGVELASSAVKFVFVSAGEYAEEVETDVSLFGGYRPGYWTRNIDSNITTIIAPGTITLQTTTDSDLIIEGFTIRADTADGLWAVVTQGKTILSRNIIKGGAGITDHDQTTGVEAEGSWTDLRNNTIDGGSPIGDNNFSVGVGHGDGVLTMRGNTIMGGAPRGLYGSSVGLFLSYGGTADQISNNIITGGEGETSAGVLIYNLYSVLSNNVISGGSASDFTYGVSIADTGRSILINNTIGGGIGSSASAVGLIGGSNAFLINNILGADDYYVTVTANAFEVIDFYGTVHLINNDLWYTNLACLVWTSFNSADHCYTSLADVNGCTWAGCDESFGNISGDPLFVNFSSGDFHLTSASPCVDSGIDPAAWYTGTLADFDFDGDARPQGAGWDIGADEYAP